MKVDVSLKDSQTFKIIVKRVVMILYVDVVCSPMRQLSDVVIHNRACIDSNKNNNVRYRQVYLEKISSLIMIKKYCIRLSN